MAFRELAYQERALKALEAYLDALKPEKARYDKAAALIADDPDLGLELPHFPAKAWANSPCLPAAPACPIRPARAVMASRSPMRR